MRLRPRRVASGVIGAAALVLAAVVACEGRAEAPSAAAAGSVTPHHLYGELDGAPERILGEVTDALVGDSGRVMILDRKLSRVVAADTSGAFLYATGRAGRGPGELFEPVALARWRGWTIILDRGNSRVARLTPGGAIEVVFPLPLFGHDLCGIDGSLFVLGEDHGQVVHMFTADGDRNASFAPSLRDTLEGPAVRYVSGAGHLACDTASGTVVVVSHLFPLVRAYSTDGSLQWTWESPGFLPTRIEPVPGGTKFSRGERGSHEHVSATIVRNRLVIQRALFSREREHPESFETFSIDLSNPGRWERLGALPRILAPLPTGLLVGTETPYPHIGFLPLSRILEGT